MDQVFGYGSLVDEPDGIPATLLGHRRAWTVAMDNRTDVPGYKRYLAPDGTRPDFVCFLDVHAGDGEVDGVCLPVDAARLAALDRRERNYERVDVTASMRGAPAGRVWTYAGLAQARARAQAGDGVVVARHYVQRVEAAFAALGRLDGYRASTDPPRAPVVELRREDL